jgi:hypothetical protein
LWVLSYQESILMRTWEKLEVLRGWRKTVLCKGSRGGAFNHD